MDNSSTSNDTSQRKKCAVIYCFVPMCPSNSILFPDKVFLTVPQEPKLRKMWMKVARRQHLPSPKSGLRCCEDHFDEVTMLVKYIMILYYFTIPPDCYSASIKSDINSAKQDLKIPVIPDVDLCSREHISAFCTNNETNERVCSARLVRKKIEFKEFDSPCYMDMNNICESLDNIWAIKNLGSCDLRRYGKEIQKNDDTNVFELTYEADDSKTSVNYQEETTFKNSIRNRRIGDVEEVTVDDIDGRIPDDEATTADAEETTTAADTEVEDVTTTNDDTTIPEDENANIKAEEDPADAEETTVAADTVDDTMVTEDDTTIAEDENANIKAEEDEPADAEETTVAADTVDDTMVTEDDTTIAEDEEATEDTTDSVRDSTTNDSTTPVDDTDLGNDDEMPVLRMVNGDNLKLSSGEIGKILQGGTVKSILRQATRFPPLNAEESFDKIPCSKRVKPCPLLYYPVCLYYERENADKVKYYYFINRCEAQQYTCYHPDAVAGPKSGSSLRTGYCSHIQYINYARFIHTISAWSHYGWLHGPWKMSHILTPSQRG